MATVTVMFSIYYFFASFVALFRFLHWSGAVRTVGYAVSVSEPKNSYSYGSGQKRKYTYEMIANDDDMALPCTYVETTGKDAEPGLALNTLVDLMVLKDQAKAITMDDYAALKKQLYINPLACAGSIGLTVLLVMLASSL